MFVAKLKLSSDTYTQADRIERVLSFLLMLRHATHL